MKKYAILITYLPVYIIKPSFLCFVASLIAVSTRIMVSCLKLHCRINGSAGNYEVDGWQVKLDP
jgi:hypothetical protein